MPHYGTLKDYVFQNDVEDIRGTVIYGRDDDKLGKIKDVIFDHGTGEIKYAVIDTGGWFTHKKFLVPANRIHQYSKDDDAFQADLTKDQIENTFPRYDEDALQTDNDWKDYENRYNKLWDEGVVQHRDDRIDLDVTPATINTGTSATGVPSEHDVSVPMGSLGEEILPEGERSARESAEREREEDLANRDLTPHRIAGEFPDPMEGSQKLHLQPDFAEDSDLDQARVGSSRVPDRAWEDDATGSGGREREAGMNEDVATANRQEMADVGNWHPRMKRFEDVLRKNRVDVTASCASCAPAKDKAA